MKKTLTVNLNNIVFHIDDDAYEMLQIYLSEIADHFQSEDEKKEIMNDIEARIAELFTEKLQKNKNVVNLTDVQEIVEIMGKPSQYTGEDEEPEVPKSDKKQQKSRRFYRDPENALLGGIGGGLAAYFNWDVTWVRVALVVLALVSSGYVILIYIIVWLIAPQAITASQRLEMQGEDVTVESIKTELNNAKNYVESDKFKQSANSVGERILDILRIFFKVAFGFVGAVLGIVGVVLVGALIMLLFLIIFEPSLINGFAPDIFSNWAIMTPEKIVLLIISLILIVGCPIFLLIYWAIRIISGNNQNTSRTPSWVILILWLAGIFMFYSIGANTLINWNRHNGEPVTINWSDDGDKQKVDEVRNLEMFQAIDIAGNIKLSLKQDSVQLVTVSSPKEYLPKFITKVENGTLYIYSREILLNHKINVSVSTKSIQSLTAKGACEIESESQFLLPEFNLQLLGASQARMDMKIAGLLNVELKGASQANLSGTCQNIKYTGVGASQLEAFDLIAQHADVEVIGASQADVYATESIDATAIGASQVDCKGSPKNIKKTSHIGSDINVE